MLLMVWVTSICFWRSTSLAVTARFGSSLKTKRQVFMEQHPGLEGKGLLNAQAEGVVRGRREAMEQGGKCVSCFLTKPFCVCARTSAIFADSSEQKPFQPHIHLFMHFKEWGRASNTGKLMQVGLGSSRCTTSIFGIQQQEDKLEQLLLSEPSIILYPRAGSVPISSMRDWFQAHGGRVQIVVIDSTWTQSQAMDRRLSDSIPRVRIDEMISGPSQFLNRKQSVNASKVCTLEATVMALAALGVEEDSLRPFEEALQYGVDACLQQSGQKPAYGNIITPAVSGISYTTACIDKPSHCPGCGITSDGVRFRNNGVRRKNLTALDHIFLDTATRDAVRGGDCSCWVLPTTYEQAPQDAGVGDEGRGPTMSYRVWRCGACSCYFARIVAGDS